MAARDDRLQMSLYPEDFDLYSIGSFNAETGKLTQREDQPKFIVGAIAFKKQREVDNDNL